MTHPTAWYSVPGYWRLLRFGIGLAGAGEQHERVDKWFRHQWGVELLLSTGLQVPMRVTPYVEFQGSLGLMHLYLYNRDAFSLAYSLSVLAGAEWFIVARMTIGVAVGWRRTIARFEGADLFTDSFFLQVSFGL
jgi:hypothetical protein